MVICGAFRQLRRSGGSVLGIWGWVARGFCKKLNKTGVREVFWGGGFSS